MKSFGMLLLVAMVGGASYACYEPPPTSIGTNKDDLSEGKKKSSAKSSDDDEAEEDEDTPDEIGPSPKDTTKPPSDSEPTEETPAPPPPPKPTPNAFADASPYVPLTTPDQSSRHHGGVTNAGKDCMMCHGAGGGAPRFAIGGTVYSGKSGAPRVQVRVVDPSGAEVALVGTDNAGNFWLPGTLTIPAGSRVAIRNGTVTRAMNATIGAGGCNQSSCHVTNRPIVLD